MKSTQVLKQVSASTQAQKKSTLALTDAQIALVSGGAEIHTGSAGNPSRPGDAGGAAGGGNYYELG